MKRIFLLLVVCFVFGGCVSKSINTTQTNNPEIKVDFLFEKDGVKVYRFYDSRRVRYFTTRGDTFWAEHYGKGQTRDVNIPGD